MVITIWVFSPQITCSSHVDKIQAAKKVGSVELPPIYFVACTCGLPDLLYQNPPTTALLAPAHNSRQSPSPGI